MTIIEKSSHFPGAYFKYLIIRYTTSKWIRIFPELTYYPTAQAISIEYSRDRSTYY